MAQHSPIHILLVEDNTDHLFLARKAISQEMGDQALIHEVKSAEEAVDYLHQTGPFSDAIRPDLVLVDVQLPGKDGFWVVRAVKQNQELLAIPVVIFTSSDADSDVQLGYECGTNIYICKPTGADEFAARLKAIPAFWSRIAELPPRKPSNGK